MRTFLRLTLLIAVSLPLAAQQITGVAPASGHYAGNEVVEIRGVNLQGTCGIVTCFPEEVFFGTAQAEVVSWTDTLITVRTPPHRIGAADVTVAARNGSAVVAPSAFSFVSGEIEEQVLLPLLMIERPGAFGSSWRTHLTIRNGFSTPMNILPYNLTVPAGGFVRDPAEITSPLTDDIPARMLWVRRDSEDILNIELRAQDMPRQGQTWGVEIPVVRETDFRVSAVSLLDIPTDPQFRVALRVYGLDRFEQFGSAYHEFVVRAYDLASGTLLSERFVVARVDEPIVTPARPVTRPAMFQMFDVVGAMPEVKSAQRIRLEVTPFSPLPVVPAPVSLFWAFASITHNETQTVTLVTP
jgi:hypothetical protein